jgi:hypothetical protein
LSRATLCAASIYLSFAMIAPAGDVLPTQPLNLFVDVNSTRLVEEVQTTEKRRIDLAGMPVLFGAARQSSGAAPSVTAGIAGGYNFDLGLNLSVKASGLLSRVHTEGAGILSSGKMGGDVAVQYKDGGTRLLLRPSLHATLQDDVLDRIDYALDAQLWQAIGWGLDLTAKTGHAWREAALIDADRETGFGRVGLHLALDDADFDLGYGFDLAEGSLASQYRFSQGPQLSAKVALANGWRLSGSYAYTQVARGYDDLDPDARHEEGRHRLRFASDWDLDSSTGADWHMRAIYNYEQTVSDDVVCLPANHFATLTFALNF